MFLRDGEMFKLAKRRRYSDGPYCGPESLYLGTSPLVEPVSGPYRVRAADEIAALSPPLTARAPTLRAFM